MSNVLSSFKEKFMSTFTGEEVAAQSKADMTPRANRGVVIGSKNNEASDTTTQPRIFDSSDEACIIRGMELLGDGGNFILTVIQKIEESQIIVVDFSESDEKDKELQYHILWGATMAFHGQCKVLDKNCNFVMFTNNNKTIGEYRHLSGIN